MHGMEEMFANYTFDKWLIFRTCNKNKTKNKTKLQQLNDNKNKQFDLKIELRTWIVISPK